MLSPWLQAVLDMGNGNWSGVGCTSGGVDLAVMQWQTHFRNLCAVSSRETPDGFLKAISQLVTQNSKMLSSFKTSSLPSLPPPTNSLSLRLKGTPPQRTHPCNKYFLLKLRRQMPITDTERECNDRRFLVLSWVRSGRVFFILSFQSNFKGAHDLQFFCVTRKRKMCGKCLATKHTLVNNRAVCFLSWINKVTTSSSLMGTTQSFPQSVCVGQDPLFVISPFVSFSWSGVL